MDTPSYLGKSFFIGSLNATLTHDKNLAESDVYVAGDLLPANTQIGDVKKLPPNTEVIVTDTKIDSHKIVYAFIQPVSGDPNLPSGWTKATNLKGQLLNELMGFMPTEWDLPPQGDNFTVVDKQAFLRFGAPNFKSTNQILAQKTYVFVLERSGAYAHIALAIKAADGTYGAGSVLGWTAAANLMPGFGKSYFSAEWTAKQGLNACWENGIYIGPKLLVNIVGTNGEMEQVTYDIVEAYLKMQQAAAAAGIELGINSGFRTYPEQANLRRMYDQGIRKDATARPGHSNHQHGPALDIRTGGFGTAIYEWLKKNAPKFGFIRTVSNEPWHWEYRPTEAAKYGYRRPGIN
jgi:hypothetical protein